MRRDPSEELSITNRDPGETPIAIRFLQAPARAANDVRIEIWRPRQVARSEFACPFRIVGIGDGAVETAHGIDAVQALQTVMDAIGARLMRFPEIRWLGQENLGFPRPDDIRWPVKLVKKVTNRSRARKARRRTRR